MKAKEPGAATPTCTPPSTASPTWPTPRPSAVEKASTTIGFFCRARAFTTTITSLVSRHQRIRPYTPQHNGKVERYNRILAEECVYTRTYTSQQQRHDAVAAPSRRPAVCCALGFAQPPSPLVRSSATCRATSGRTGDVAA